MKDPRFKVVYRPLDTLSPLENNPRYIKKDDFERLCASVQNNSELFEAQPIILSNRTGKNVIIAGNQRYRAAIEVGLKEVPTILLEGLTEAKEKEIIIRSNVTNGKWDYDILASGVWGELEELTDWGVECNFLGSQDEDLNVDEMIDEERAKKAGSQDSCIEVTIPEQLADKLDEIKGIITESLKDYEGIKVK